MLACAAAGLLLSCAARAQLSASVSVDSDYRVRGVSLSGSKPTVRLTANIDTASGWYGGASATQAEVSQGDRYAQIVGYAGYAMPIAAGRALEFGASYSHFMSNRQYDFAEAYAGLLSERWSLRLNYSPEYFGRPVQTAYLDASGHLPLTDIARLFGHIGLLAPVGGGDSAITQANRSRADLRVGMGWALRELDLRIAWTAVSRGGPFPALYDQRRSALLVSASYSF
jgi:uncharacterized protein (TIGR02001 family)